jgi:hypothetical protein
MTECDKSAVIDKSHLSGGQSAHFSNVPDRDRRNYLSSPEDRGEPTKEEINYVFEFNEIAVKENELASYLFDYFEEVPSLFKTYFFSTAASIKSIIKEYQTYHYFKLTRIDSKEKAGMVCFGCKSWKEISIVHLSVINEADFEMALSDTRAILLREFPTVNCISLLIRYPTMQVTKNINGFTCQVNQTIWKLDQKLFRIVKSIGFDLKFIDSGINSTKRVAGFRLYRSNYSILMRQERLVLSHAAKDQKAVNLKFRMSILIANNVIVKIPKKYVKKLVETEFGLGLPEDDLMDIRAPIQLLLGSYAQLYSKWNKHDFLVPGYGISLKDLSHCKSRLSLFKVSLA